MVDVLVLVISLADTKDLVSITLNTHTRSQPSDIGAKLAPCSLLLLAARSDSITMATTTTTTVPPKASLFQSMALGGMAASFAVNFTHPIVRMVMMYSIVSYFIVRVG
jgi:hypothetical protein